MSTSLKFLLTNLYLTWSNVLTAFALVFFCLITAMQLGIMPMIHTKYAFINIDKLNKVIEFCDFLKNHSMIPFTN